VRSSVRALDRLGTASTATGGQEDTLDPLYDREDRGVPHIHALLTESADSPRRMHMVDWCKANFGIARIFQYQRGLGAAHYLGKYLVKDHGAAKDNFDIDFSETLDIERVM